MGSALPDIVASAGSSVVYAQNTGGGTSWSSFTSIDSLSNLMAVAVAFIDADNFLDIIALARLMNGVSMAHVCSLSDLLVGEGAPCMAWHGHWTRRGIHSLRPCNSQPSTPNPWAHVCAVCVSPPQEAYWYKNSGAATPTFTRYQIGYQLWRPTSMLVTDITRVGAQPLAVSNEGAASRVCCWLQGPIPPGAARASSSYVRVAPRPSHPPTPLPHTHAHQDGLPDVVTVGGETGYSFRVYLNTRGNPTDSSAPGGFTTTDLHATNSPILTGVAAGVLGSGFWPESVDVMDVLTLGRYA